MLTREQIAARVARELPDGAHVHLDADWSALIHAALPAGVTLKEQAGDVAVAVVSAGAVANDGSYVGTPLPGKAERVIALLSTPRGEGGASCFPGQLTDSQGKADLVLTPMALFDVTPEGLVMREVARGVSAADVQRISDAPLLASDELKVMNV